MSTVSPAPDTNDTPADAAEVREWARITGQTVGARGRLSAAVVEAFTAATGRTYKPAK